MTQDQLLIVIARMAITNMALADENQRLKVEIENLKPAPRKPKKTPEDAPKT